jgi:hypothetical protein
MSFDLWSLIESISFFIRSASGFFDSSTSLPRDIFPVALLLLALSVVAVVALLAAGTVTGAGVVSADCA